METMEGMAPLWGYQEGVDDLRHKLYCTTLELEAVRTKAEEEMRKNEENIKQLLQLLQLTSQERDEARDQLQRLLNRLIPIEASPIASNLQPESPSIRPTIGNSSITESDSLSDTCKHQPHASSSPMNSPDLSSINFADSNISPLPHAITPNQKTNPMPVASFSSGPTKFERASTVVDSFVTNRPLPEKGKLLQAVIGAGPLLKTLLVAGPLPRWRNPPPLQPLQIPPFAVKGCDGEILNANTIGLLNYVGQNYSNQLHLDGSIGTPQVYSASALNYTGVSGLCIRKRPLLSPCVGNYQNCNGKRQKSHSIKSCHVLV